MEYQHYMLIKSLKMKNSYWLLNTPKLKLEFPHAFTIAVAKREICKDVKICIALEKNHRKNIQND